MGNEKKLLKLLPDKLLNTASGIDVETRDTVVQIWKVIVYFSPLHILHDVKFMHIGLLGT